MKENKPSQTAVWIAKGLLFLDKTQIITEMDPKSLQLLNLCLKKSDPLWLKLLPYRIFQVWFALVEKITIPGIFLHYFFRKKIIERWLKNSLQNDCEQVIIFAAGFETLVQHWSEKYPGVNFVEIDHPATQNIKKEAFMQLNPSLKNVHFIEFDLSKNRLQQAFMNNHIDPLKKTFFIAEGITMYFDKTTLDQLFIDCHHFFQPGTLIAFTFMEKQKNGSIQFKNASILVNPWLKRQQEVFKWGIEPSRLESEFLLPLGFKQIDLINPLSEKESAGTTFSLQTITQGEYVSLALLEDKK